MSERRAREFEALLDEERGWLLAGTYGGLPGLAERKAKALADLRTWGLDSERLGAISRKVARNQSLLSAAIKGVKATRVQVETLKQEAGKLSTYDNVGHKTEIGAARRGLERKA